MRGAYFNYIRTKGAPPTAAELEAATKAEESERNRALIQNDAHPDYKNGHPKAAEKLGIELPAFQAAIKEIVATQLFLEDLAGKSDEDVRHHIRDDFEAPAAEIKRFEILIAYESVGAYGCDSSAWFLLRECETGKLFEVHGSHCSCYGFEGQFEPEPTTLEYLKSDKFHFTCGGDDGDRDKNTRVVREFIKTL